MAMQRPIVAAALDQIGDVISGRGATKLGPMPAGIGKPCGLTFEPGDQRGFRQALHRVLDEPALAAELAQAARAEVLARYTWKQHVGAIIGKMAELKLIAS
jgi:glycosyltransferase involved in cell wall biosynthesis